MYGLLACAGLLVAACGKDYPGMGELLPGDVSGEGTSHWYYSYEAARLIGAEELGMGAAEDFTPNAVAHVGDTLFIANMDRRGIACWCTGWGRSACCGR